MIDDVNGHVKGHYRERGTKGDGECSGRVKAANGLSSGEG
jgi:hypothetical protein